MQDEDDENMSYSPTFLISEVPSMDVAGKHCALVVAITPFHAVTLTHRVVYYCDSVSVPSDRQSIKFRTESIFGPVRFTTGGTSVVSISLEDTEGQDSLFVGQMGMEWMAQSFQWRVAPELATLGDKSLQLCASSIPWEWLQGQRHKHFLLSASGWSL